MNILVFSKGYWEEIIWGMTLNPGYIELAGRRIRDRIEQAINT